jgi:hypothetical protein
MGWNTEWLRRRLPECVIAAGTVLSVLGLSELGRDEPDPLVSRRLAGWALTVGVVLLMTGITALQNAQLDRRRHDLTEGDEVPNDRATPPSDPSSSPEGRAPVWQLWRHW